VEIEILMKNMNESLKMLKIIKKLKGQNIWNLLKYIKKSIKISENWNFHEKHEWITKNVENHNKKKKIYEIC